ncbi:cupin domain-containing protein [Streptomyces boncukensis]|uniref:Cupin domain-containing protein n=1 Tax=Streptomyces boncukensis TaxID=2711219 RepID=A0A6G4X7S2_9ACTN|nr:cupin domain-containing protein [Streptomyces boncukensis]NGO72900.1 cupin domain-containing protein [Streptomyces boncukensis]
MSVVDIRKTAADLPDAWSSLPLVRVAGSDVKVLRMDGRPLAPESHEAAEALLVVEGTLRLLADGVETDVRAGELYVVEAGVEHAVRPGSRGTLVIVERSADAAATGARTAAP